VFLRSLTLKGFKSFAEPTTLEFEPGITVVVGPNGSGKSNVVDAVAWVLGAQGPRTVRSTKMDDVIFAGTGRRAALGRAEVALTIDNSAGLLPIELNEVTITRTLFRTSGESEYALNGVPCRLLDVQELLSDTGVGRQQHLIVSQGNLDAVLDARPEDRRLIVEEAAGILKFRRRKEKAQRRLDGTEANLVRLTDLLREVGRQIKPLEKQADAARRHGDLVAELFNLRLYLRGRELAGLAAHQEAAAQSRSGLVQAETAVRAELAELDTAVAAVEDELDTAGRARLGEDAGRLEALRERARGLAAVVAERRRSVDRDLSATVDSSLVAALDDEAARLRAELAGADDDAERLAARSWELDGDEAALGRERASAPPPEPESAAQLALAAEARGALSALRSGIARGQADDTRLEERRVALKLRADMAVAQADRAEQTLQQLDADDPALAAALAAAEADRAAASAEAVAAEAAVQEAASGLRAARARVEVLEMVVDEHRGTGDARRLLGVAGVVGTLLDLVHIDTGYEAAFEAAVADAVGSLVVDGVTSARRLLADLGAGEPTGLLLLGPAAPARDTPPAGGPERSLRAVVRARHDVAAHAGVDRLLDVLLASVVVVDGGRDEAVDVTLAHPEVVVVTKAGDRISATGWRLGAGAPGAARGALDHARAECDDLAAALGGAEGRRAAAGTRLATADEAASRCREEATTTADRRRRVAAEAERARAEARRLASELDAVRAQQAALAGRLRADAARVAELEASLPAPEAEAAAAARMEAQRAERQHLRARTAELAALRAELDVAAARLEERRDSLQRRLGEVEARMTAFGARRQEAEARRQRLDSTATALARLGRHLHARQAEIDDALADVRVRRDRHAAAVRDAITRLDGLRSRRTAAERRLEELRERARRAELDEAESRMRLEAAVEALRRELDCEPEMAVAAACPPLGPGSSPANRARELERELRLMGPVNPLALEELAALQERHAFLTAQLDDVKGSRRELVKVIRAVEAEMAELLGAALADVTDHFAALFETLFPGGHGRLTLTDPDHILETGIELEARPAGKNVRKLSLLSGGERSLCALAFLFAVFRSRPSPFYLLDEVEAALDDVNLHRFLDLLDEFRAEAQLVVVTHQKRTMEAADCLLGVTLQPGGSSKVVSERARATA
jgi:chromosome segregation protein